MTGLKICFRECMSTGVPLGWWGDSFKDWKRVHGWVISLNILRWRYKRLREWMWVLVGREVMGNQEFIMLFLITLKKRLVFMQLRPQYRFVKLSSPVQNMILHKTYRKCGN